MGARALRDGLPGALGAYCRALDAADRAAEGALLGPRAAIDTRAVFARLCAAVMTALIEPFATKRGLSPGSAGEEAWARALCAAPTGVRWAELEVEEVVGAYEELVGFELRVARGATLVVVPLHVGVDLDAVLATPPAERASRVEQVSGSKPSARVARALERAGSTPEIAGALARRASPRWPLVLEPGALYVEPGESRRRAGAHYTPRALTGPLVERALAPLLAGADAARVAALRVCDPAMGTGAFLVEVGRQLAARLTELDASLDAGAARRIVAERCLYGVDADPIAVDLARAALWLFVGDPALPREFADRHLCAGDALLGDGDAQSRTVAEATARAIGRVALHWRGAFPEVMARGGFDAFVGNPPWVAYAGRAAQPLAREVFAYYAQRYAAFRGYRTLHGLFIERAASLLSPGGRLGLVVPTSVSDLAGYAPTRRAHDALALVDAELPDFGDAFEGVFQPSMGLLSTRVTGAAAGPEVWPVARDDLDPAARALLARLSAMPPLPPECFGERGFQSMGEDVKKLRATPHPDPPFVVPIREGSDVRACQALPPRLHLDPAGLRSKLRATAEWREVHVLVRQTARFPVAALADGVAFRNSVLAGFASAPYSAEVLLAYLNAAPIRWLHYARHRDARQGMPQVKIAHLRSIPRVPGDTPAHLSTLARLGSELGARNSGIAASEQRAIDDAAAQALGLDEAERAVVAKWAEAMPAP